MAIAQPSGRFSLKTGTDSVTLQAGKASAKVSLKDGRIQFFNAKGQPVLQSVSADLQPVTVEGQSFVAPSAQFNRGTREAFYGRAAPGRADEHEWRGRRAAPAQHGHRHPFVVSDRNYGLLWDNNAVTRFGNPIRFGLASRDLQLTALDGSTGLTASYYVDDQLVLTRVEPDIRYQFLSDLRKHWPTDPRLSREATRQEAEGRLGGHDGVHQGGPAQDAPLWLGLLHAHGRRQDGL